MNQSSFILLLLLSFFFHVKAQAPLSRNDASTQDAVTAFKPSLAVVIGILCIMFSLTFVLLVYAKFCHGHTTVFGDEHNLLGAQVRPGSQFSGIDKTVIESLPFFRFSSLKGWKEGLECAVCLSKFEDVEILRLLPKCKHAFHIDCIDQWLEKHSSCPLCRVKVSAEDPEIFAYSNSLRFLWSQSETREDSNLELFVQRQEDHHGSSRFSIGGSFRKVEKGNKEEAWLIKDGEKEQSLHKLNHKIIVSDAVFKNRWSSVSSSDLMLLNSEMLEAMSNSRFSGLQLGTNGTIEDGHVMNIKEEMERKRLFENKLSGDVATTSEFKANLSTHKSKSLIPSEKRSMSEITGVSRFADLRGKNRFRETTCPENDVKEQRMRRAWLPIARRTVEWFANRERGAQESQQTKEHLEV